MKSNRQKRAAKLALNPSYYTCIYRADDKETIYWVYEPIYNPIILFSKADKSPLVALALKSTTPDSNIHLIPTTCENFGTCITLFNGNRRDKRPDSQLAEYEFILTNLTDIGEIKIDIMRENESAKCTNPGPEKSINRINELYPLQTHPIRFDQNTPRRRLTFQAGQRIHIAVSPRADKPDLIAKFADAYWDRVSFFCIRVSVNSGNMRTRDDFKRTETGISPAGTLTNIEYLHDVPTNLDNKLCIVDLFLSNADASDIMPKLSKKITQREIAGLARMTVDEYIERDTIQKIKVYKSDECIICLDETNEPNAIVIPCGHMCLHIGCIADFRWLAQCPVCRGSIEKIITARASSIEVKT